jgi:small subunit ribosomal protein S18
MSRFSRFGPGPAPTLPLVKSGKGVEYVDYKDVESLRRLMTPNGKIYGRKRVGANEQHQKMVAQAIKRARFLGLLPYTSATL